MEEREKLAGLARHDKKAVETIYRENYDLVQALVVKNNGTTEDARDIFQEAMIVLFQKVSKGTPELSCLIRTFLYSVSRRLWLKRLMQQNRMQISDTEEESIGVEDEMEDHEQRNLEFSSMERALSGIGEPCKSLLDAFYLQKRSMQDIAIQFGYTNPENAKNQKYKCLVRLKKLFFAQYKNGNN